MPTAEPSANLFRSAPAGAARDLRGTRVALDGARLSTAAQWRAGPAEGPTPPSPALDVRAAQRRALDLALQVRCPDRLHWQAQVGVPCTPPDTAHVWGWVCLARIEHEVTTRAERERAAARRRARAVRRGSLARQAARRSAERARITALIHEAAQR